MDRGARKPAVLRAPLAPPMIPRHTVGDMLLLRGAARPALLALCAALCAAPAGAAGRGRLDGDLTGAWVGGKGTRLAFAHSQWGKHHVSGTWDGRAVSGRATLTKRLDNGFAEVEVFLKGIRGLNGTWRVGPGRTRLTRACWNLDRAVPKGRVRLKLMTYNVKGVWHLGKLDKVKIPYFPDLPYDYDLYEMDRLKRFIQEHDPDVVALQEVAKIQLPGSGNQAEAAVKDLGYEVRYVRARGKTYDVKGWDAPIFVEEGEAILVRRGGGLDIIADRKLELPSAEKREDGGDLKRVAVSAIVRLKTGRTMQFVSAHLSHTKEFAPSRRLQAQHLAAHVGGPAVFLGDFNARSEDAAMQPLLKRCVDVVAAAFSGGAPDSVGPVGAGRRIDHIYATKSLRARPLGAWVAGHKDRLRGFSDHRPVLTVVDFDLR